MIYIFVLLLCAIHPGVLSIEDGSFSQGNTEGLRADAEGYYWRKYIVGVIPPDAVSAGSGDDGTPVYVGQLSASYNNSYGLIPAPIRPNENLTYVTVGEYYYRSDGNLLILCSTSKDRLQWIPISDSSFSDTIKNLTLVESGSEFDDSEFGYPLYIGRAVYEGLRVVGKIRDEDLGNYVKGRLYFYYPEEHERFSSEYEILAYV